MFINRYPVPAVLVSTLIVAAQWGTAESAIALNPDEISTVAKQVTVLISGQNPGSGVIIDRDNDTYTVLTAFHVVNTPDEYEVVTAKDEHYPLNYQSVKRLPGTDLATLTFKSQANYTTASLGKTQSVTEGKNVYVTGFPAPSEAINLSIYSFTEGRLIANSSKLLADGYSLVYSNATQPGMSGGPVFNDQGQLIGIHGRADSKLQNGVYFKQDKNLGIAIDTFLAIARQSGIEIKTPSATLAAPSTPSLPQSPRPASLAPVQNAGDFYLSALDKNHRGDNTGALQDLNQAIRINPNLAEAYSDRAGVKIQLGDRLGALSDLDQALRLNPSLAVAYAYRGVYRAVDGNFSGADADVAQALSLQPPLGYSSRGIVRWYKNDQTGALSDFDRALAQNSSFNEAADIHYARGTLRWQLGNPQGALADFNQAIALRPQYAEVYGARALLFFQTNQSDRAQADFQRALDLNPGYVDIYQIRSVIRLVNGDYAGALADGNKVIRLNPSNDIYAVTGLAHFQLGNRASALQEFQLGAQRVLDPNSQANYRNMIQNLGSLPNDPSVTPFVSEFIQSELQSFIPKIIDDFVRTYRPFQNS